MIQFMSYTGLVLFNRVSATGEFCAVFRGVRVLVVIRGGQTVITKV